MTSGLGSQGYRHIRGIQRTLRRLELVLREMEAQAPELRPHDSRSELLEQIHVAGAMEQRRLFELLDQRAIGHTWIGTQVGAEYLEMWHAADGRSFYRVTERAIRELHLGQLASAATYASLSESTFGDDWQSEEDSAYDRL
ncbi:MAG: hypothetical protein ACE5Q6_01165 [Dehalococcoidia bacterium]